MTLHDFQETEIACVSLSGGRFMDRIIFFWMLKLLNAST